MKHITFYLDFISPYAYLAFEKLPEALLGHSYSVTYKPILFAALLKHHGQLGPAEIAPKRDWTYRQVLRLAVACAPQGLPNRYVCETLFKHVWHGGLEATDAERLQAVTQQLAPQRALESAAVKTQLKAHTDDAIACGVFGVPTLEVDGKLFWGLDSLPMLRDYLAGDAWFATAWSAAAAVAPGVRR